MTEANRPSFARVRLDRLTPVLLAAEPPSLPRAPGALLPFFWSRVLFPGQCTDDTRARWSSLFVLMALPALLLYPSLGFHLFEPDEGRYAEIPREMLARVEWVVPYLQGEPYLDKPPLFYWLVMLSYRCFGISATAARLVPALAVHICLLLTYFIGRRSVGERAAFWGALLLSLAPGFLSVGRLLILDSLLTLWATLALLAGYEALRGGRLRWGWWLTAATACGLGVLTKGPVILVLFAPPLLAFGWLGKGLVRPSRRALAAFALVVLGLNLPWYVAASIALPEFPRYFFWEHNVVRFLTPFAHREPVWYYGPVMLAGLMPGTLLLVSFARFLGSGDEGVAPQRTPALGYLLLAGGWCVAFFTLSDCKLTTYVMPAFPPLSLALGYYLTRNPIKRWGVAVGMAFALGVAVIHQALLPKYAEHRSPMRDAAMITAYCSDPAIPVVCYPRNCDSVAFYLKRDDLRPYRSKETPRLVDYLQTQPRTVILFTHRHSLEGLRKVLPPQMTMTDETPLCGSAKLGPEGMLYLAVVRRVDGGR